MAEPLYLFMESALPIPLYWLGLFLALLACAGLFLLTAGSQGIKKGTAASFLALALPLALLLGRLVYALVQQETIFYDEMGEYGGLAAFFLPGINGFNIIGAMAGILAAAFLAARFSRVPLIRLLDAAAIPAALLFTLARLLEPLGGQGYGEAVYAPFPQFYPFSLENDMGERLLLVSFLSALLAFIVLLVLLIKRKGLARPGFKTVFLLVFLAIPQIIPESLRRDDVLFIFIFARVTQVGYMLLYAGTSLYVLLRSKARGVPAGRLALKGVLILLLIGVCIGCEFALDKTNYPKEAIYAVFVLALSLMAGLTWKSMEGEPA